MQRVVSRIDLVLISHPDFEHMGALPYVVGKMGLKAPIYGTLPIFRMGQITMYDAYQAMIKTSTLEWYNLDDIDAVFEKFKQLKYSEKLTLTSKGEGIVITPHNAGHIIGGSIWRISKETDEIIYAVDYNHRSEHVLSKTVLDTFTRPTLLITDSRNFNTVQPKLKNRDGEIMKYILTALRKGGNVLIPCDSAGRVLEIMRVLDQYWIQNRLRDPIALLHDMSYYVSKAAQAMLEWCNEKITKHFDIGRQNPFQYANINLLHSMEDLDKLSSPKVVLATSASLERGYGRQLLLKWGQDPNNMIIFTGRSPHGSLAWQISQEDAVGKTFDISITDRVELQGQELAAHEAEERRKAQAELELKAKAEEESAMENMILGIEDFESDSEEEEPQDADQLRGSYKVGFGQFASSKFPMYFYVEPKVQFDEYGQIVQASDFVDPTSKKPQAAQRRKMLQIEEDAMDVEGEEEARVEENKPTKAVTTLHQLKLQAKVVRVNFEGLADGRAIKNCISNVKPRKLILVHGTNETTAALKDFVLKSVNYCDAVFTPSALECVDIESDTNVYKLQLKESLYTAMYFENVGAHDVAYLTAEIDFPKDSAVPILQQIEDEFETGHDPLRLSQGNVKLDSVKQLLAREGFESHFRGGMLVCADGVVLKRLQSNCIGVEGVLSEKYFQIRTLLYDHYTLI